MKTTSFIFIFAVAVFYAAVPPCFSADQNYEACLAPLRCGTGPTRLPSITYPFWGVNKPNYCGQKEFLLSCENGQNLTLDVKNFSLRVLTFSLENQTLTVADENLFEGGCPYMSLNFTGSNQFPIAPTVEKIDLFTCPGSQRVNPLSPFTCGRSDGSMVTYYALKPLDTVSDCIKFGEVPVLRSAKDDFQQSRLTLAETLVKVFDLRYTMRDGKSCSGCLLSGGVCGSVPGSEAFQCLCSDRPHESTCYNEDTRGSGNVQPKIIIGVAGGVVIVLMIIAVVLWKVKTSSQQGRNLEVLIPLKQYSYAYVKKMTKSFRCEIGKGGFGIVYRGKLSDGRKVAVKVLKDSKSNGEDFINEVASMSRTSHVNIVTLLGFCYEGSKRAIIYEFLGNGSLDKFISGNTAMNMDWTTLYRIALGVARGLEYLHHGCKTRIVHFDIKPHNVLLDENLCPKVSDFGLAKICEKKESILSLLDTRGTIGYIAPEMISRVYGRVSHKSDVYSYGMLVLEMIGARNKEKANQASASNISSMYFPEWVYRDLELGKSRKLIKNGINIEEDEIAKKITLVGLWCIQASPSDRPPMNRVVEMLVGSLDALEVPPRPIFQQISSATLAESFGISGESTGPSKV